MATNPNQRLFFDRLLNRLDPHAPRDQDALTAQLLCGRWLALRRLHRQLSLAALAEQSGIDQTSLFLLETGVGAEDPVTADAVQRAAALLGDDQASVQLAQAAILIAAGVIPADGATMAAINAQLPPPAAD